MPELIRIKRSTFRWGTILLYAFFLSLIAYTFMPQILTPKPGEKSLRCEVSQLYVGLARAAGQNCTSKCTNWEAADCSGYSSCYNKNVSCNNGVDQNGRPCKGCCYDCEVVCEPTDEPPAISGSISCGQWGNNGWCINSAQLNLSTSDPQGYAVSINGNASGAFSCNGNCSIDLSTGSGVANYVATASQSGLSASGSASWNYDPESPNIGLNVSGSNGQNGWYRSAVTITPTGSDSISGLAGTFVSVNGGAWQASATLSDGKYDVVVTAADNAGNTADSSTTISVDTVTPSMSVSTKGNTGKNGWYASATTVSVSASDATSGVASIEVRVDGGSYRPYSSSIVFSNGSHAIQFRATDKAGNSTESSVKDILIDLNNPSANLSVTDPGNGIVTYKLHDDESGLASVYMTIENKNGKYPKMSWNKKISGKNLTEQYPWDGKIPGETTPQPGVYIVWLKVVDQAGNQDTQVASLAISESGAFSVSSKENTLQGDDPIPSMDFDEEGNLAAQSTAPDLMYGGIVSESSEVESNSLSLSVGESSGANHPPFPWGLVAVTTTVAAGTATYIATKPKKSEAQKQRTRARLLAELEAKWDAKARIANAVRGRGITNKIARLEAKEVATQEMEKRAKKQLIAEEKQKKKKAAEEKAGLAALYNARKQGEQDAAKSALPKEKSWWEKTLSIVQEKITPKKIATTLLVATLGLQALPWANNIVNDTQIFLDAKTHAEVILDELRAKHPPKPENLSFSYIFEHPYDVFSTGTDVLNAFTSIGASYADTIWQQNPFVKFQNKTLESLENSICTSVKNESWANRCTAGFYLTSGLTATPFDTTLGILNSFVVDPISGLIKQEALVAETLEAIPELLSTIQHEGWESSVEFAKELFNKNVQTVLNDKQMQSALFFETLILLGLFAAPVAGGVILGTTANGLIELDTTITNTKNKKSLVDLIRSHETRTMVVSSALVLAMMGMGLEHKFSEFKAFQDKLPPSAQSAFQNLSLMEQTQFADLAIKQQLSPNALEFYFQETGEPNSTLGKLPLSQGLKLSSLVDIYGKEMVTKFLPFCEKNGINPYDVLTRPPTEGQSLIGWGLGIEDPANPSNHPILKLNLTETEINNILTAATKNPNSKVVVLGYGKGASVPYFILGDKITGTYLSLSAEEWAPFENAKANFLTDINIPFIENGIESRKIFLFNIKYDVIIDPVNVERFSLPELRLIEMEKNNYVQVPVGDYTAYVPVELLDTYQEYIPEELFTPGE